MTGFPALSNVVMPENSSDPSQTSSNAPHETEPEYVNESANRSGGFAEAVPATSSATPQAVAAAVRSLVMPAFPCSLPPGLPHAHVITMSRGSQPERSASKPAGKQ